VRALWCVNRYSFWQFDEDDAEHSPLIWTNMNKIVYHASCQQPQFRLSSRDPASDDWFYVFPHRFLIVDQLQGWLFLRIGIRFAFVVESKLYSGDCR
jgi:hypothetical protein